MAARYLFAFAPRLLPPLVRSRAFVVRPAAVALRFRFFSSKNSGSGSDSEPKERTPKLSPKQLVDSDQESDPADSDEDDFTPEDEEFLENLEEFLDSDTDLEYVDLRELQKYRREIKKKGGSIIEREDVENGKESEEDQEGEKDQEGEESEEVEEDDGDEDESDVLELRAKMYDKNKYGPDTRSDDEREDLPPSVNKKYPLNDQRNYTLSYKPSLLQSKEDAKPKERKIRKLTPEELEAKRKNPLYIKYKDFLKERPIDYHAPRVVAANLTVRTYDKTMANMYCDFVRKTAKSMLVPCSKMIRMPNHVRKFTLLRSPHGDKKARDQFEVRTHSRLIQFFNVHPDCIDKLLRYVEHHVPVGLGVRVRRFTYEEPSSDIMGDLVVGQVTPEKPPPPAPFDNIIRVQKTGYDPRSLPKRFQTEEKAKRSQKSLE